MSTQVRRGADPALMRRINVANTLRTLYYGDTLTLTQLVEVTGLGRKAGEASVSELVSRGLVEDLPPAPGTGTMGRPARTFRFRPDAGHVLCLDIDVDRVTAAIADLRGVVQSRLTQPVHRTSQRAERLRGAIDTAQRCMAEAELDASDFWATTVATPGIVEDQRRVSMCHIIPEWSELALADELEGHLPGPIAVENHVNLAAMGEHWRGVASDVTNLVWVLTGPRFNAAILIDGSLHRGINGAAGEIGWLPHLGWQAASKQVVNLVAKADGDEPQQVTQDEIEAFATSLAPGLSALALTLNPECLVIGGLPSDISWHTDLAVALAGHMKPYCLHVPDLRFSSLGRDAVTLGAVRMSLDRVEGHLFSVASPITANAGVPSE